MSSEPGAGQIEKAIEDIQSSNGYAATAPEERNYVVSQLTSFCRHLKTEAQIQWMQVNTFALEPLGLAIERFGNAASGLVAQAAKQAILDWLKRNASKLVEWFVS